MTPEPKTHTAENSASCREQESSATTHRHREAARLLLRLTEAFKGFVDVFFRGLFVDVGNYRNPPLNRCTETKHNADAHVPSQSSPRRALRSTASPPQPASRQTQLTPRSRRSSRTTVFVSAIWLRVGLFKTLKDSGLARVPVVPFTAPVAHATPLQQT